MGNIHIRCLNETDLIAYLKKIRIRLGNNLYL